MVCYPHISGDCAFVCNTWRFYQCCLTHALSTLVPFVPLLIPCLNLVAYYISGRGLIWSQNSQVNEKDCLGSMLVYFFIFFGSAPWRVECTVEKNTTTYQCLLRPQLAVPSHSSQAHCPMDARSRACLWLQPSRATLIHCLKTCKTHLSETRRNHDQWLLNSGMWHLSCKGGAGNWATMS